MTGSKPRGHQRAEQEGAPSEVPAAELERARRAYSGSLEAARAWRAFSPDPKFHDTTFWALFATLFAEPGMNRTRLVDRIVAGAGVSRSTAERAVRDARAKGFIVGEPTGTEVLFSLSRGMFAHCMSYFRNWLDATKIARTLGYAEDSHD